MPDTRTLLRVGGTVRPVLVIGETAGLTVGVDDTAHVVLLDRTSGSVFTVTDRARLRDLLDRAESVAGTVGPEAPVPDGVELLFDLDTLPELQARIAYLRRYGPSGDLAIDHLGELRRLVDRERELQAQSAPYRPRS